MFDENWELIAFPLMKRERASAERRLDSERAVLTSSAMFKEVFTDLDKNTDLSNIPLTEAQENRLAWLGVELQPLNKELARANGVSDLSRDGEIGALVSYVYPDSPAERAGIEIGYVLLRLHVEGYPKPIEVKIGEHIFSRGMFPWDKLDELPEQYYDQIPQPWVPAENTFTRAMTDVGFGKKFEAEFCTDGKVLRKEFAVTQSPPHYDSARRHKTELLGLTVRNLTYEVRRYFHKEQDEPGVIISKIEPGSKASVAGIKPFEMVTHVNGKEVFDVDDFDNALKEATRFAESQPTSEPTDTEERQLRLSVKRMMKGRVVRIKTK
jgi:hypothetical protein